MPSADISGCAYRRAFFLRCKHRKAKKKTNGASAARAGLGVSSAEELDAEHEWVPATAGADLEEDGGHQRRIFDTRAHPKRAFVGLFISVVCLLAR